MVSLPPADSCRASVLQASGARRQDPAFARRTDAAVAPTPAAMRRGAAIHRRTNVLLDVLITPAYAQAARGRRRRRPDGVPADGRDLRRLLFPADPAAAEARQGNEGDARSAAEGRRGGHRRRHRRQDREADDQYATVEIATERRDHRAAQRRSRSCCPRARSRRSRRRDRRAFASRCSPARRTPTPDVHRPRSQPPP